MSDSKWQQILDVVKKLRHPKKGCPWDLSQTHESLTPYAIEEAYELEEAIESKNQKDIISELGDVLLQVLLHSQIASENKKFNIDDVIQTLSEKMIRRHPHVFATTKVKNAKEVMKNWELIKKQESLAKSKDQKIKKLFGFAKNLPSLVVAQKIGKRTEQYKFDWNNASQVLAKVDEEIAELKSAIRKKDKKNINEELGDVLFTLAQLGRHLEIDTDKSLRQSNRKFMFRFSKMIRKISGDVDKFVTLAPAQKEKLWNSIK